jgi:hypothetical protein
MNNATMRGLVCSLFNVEMSNIPHIIDINANAVQALLALCIGLMLHTIQAHVLQDSLLGLIGNI